MGREIKRKPIITCWLLFALCLCARIMEYFMIRTDETVIGENLLHKVIGILLLLLVLRAADMTWSEIGFGKHGIWKSILQGILLGGACFGVSYGVELGALAMQGKAAHMELYISGFSLTGMALKHTEILFFLLCIVFNLINVWMEEGLFRGFFISVIWGKYSFGKANWIAALFFGVWHFVMPVRSFMNGELEFHEMLLLAGGYMLLSGVMSIKWGLLYQMTGNLWLGAADHFFNNTVATNMLHVVTDSGADELQILRIMLAQVISCILVAVMARTKEATRNKPE